ncbi:hypothetical protein [Erwinia sp. CGal63]|uniref:hypothetical protein n=1 Tax=Erwinia sp. CGal63 TaxID=2919889 RepID=UPI003009E2D0
MIILPPTARHHVFDNLSGNKQRVHIRVDDCLPLLCLHIAEQRIARGTGVIEWQHCRTTALGIPGKLNAPVPKGE